MTEKKLVFIHDGPLFYDADGNYYEFAYHELLQRYSYMANDISFMMRTKPIEGTKKYTQVPAAIKVISVPNFKSPKTFLKNKKNAEKIVEDCIRENDIFVLRTQSSIAQLAVKYIRKYNKPYIVESVGCSWDSYWNHGLLGKVVAPYMFYKTRSIIGRSKYVYYVTTEFLQKRYPSKGVTISCSNVVLEKLQDQVLESRLERIKKFDPRSKVVLGTAAALDTPYKGQEYVIRALKDLVKSGYDIEYHLAGGMLGNSGENYLKELADELGLEDRVKFVGSLSSDRMPAYYDSIDIYIQPSKQEGLPRAVIEAMSRGCPCIGTNIAGIPELIRHVQQGSMTVKVSIRSGEHMSYHSHDYREEVWTVVSGRGKATVDGMEQILRTGDVITIAAGCKHMVEAETDLDIIEVQIGEAINVDDKKKYEIEK